VRGKAKGVLHKEALKVLTRYIPGTTLSVSGATKIPALGYWSICKQ